MAENIEEEVTVPQRRSLLDRWIQFSLDHRALVLLVAFAVLVVGAQVGRQLPVEVLPDLTKPTVTILTECPGLAPEEVEALVSSPIEAAVQGVGGLDRVRSSSDVGLSLVFAEFGWNTDIYQARQWVQERLLSARDGLPAGVKPALTPVASLMGEILLVGMRSTNGAITPRHLRTLADWSVRRRLQSVPGVAEVLAIGGGVEQIQVQPDPVRLAALGVTLAELESAVARASGDATSGYLQAGPRELMVRNLGTTTNLTALGETVVKSSGNRRIRVSDVAVVTMDVQPMRGDASVNGTPGVILSIDKAPGFDTLRVTAAIETALKELQPGLPAGVTLELLFRQGEFIDHALHNLRAAIRDGAIMVTLVLLLFLLSIRTTLVTLAALPLSFAVTLLVFWALGVSVNSMTLGGLAVAIGMVVDDAIVDVENVHRRLRENGISPAPRPVLAVVSAASSEVRNSILYATALVILVFLPLLGLEGLSGRLFTPIAMATMVSMAASFVVSLTVIPVLCSLLLPRRAGALRHADTWLVRWLKRMVEVTFLRVALRMPLVVLGGVGVLLMGSLALYPRMGKNFLPPFNEGSATISLASPPGTSLAQVNETGEVGVRLLQSIPEVKSVGRRAGRAERDDHVMPVSVNEFDVEFHAQGRPRSEVFRDIRQKLGAIPGTFVNVGQPLAHRLSHMLSGVSAKLAVKIFGPDLAVLRDLGERIEKIARQQAGLTDVTLEAQVPIPQVRILVDPERAARLGLPPVAIHEQVSTLLGGRSLAQLRTGSRTLDLVLRLAPSWRDSPDRLGELPLNLPDGRQVPLRLVAEVVEARGPSVIQRENGQRRLVLSANPDRPDLERLARELEEIVRREVPLPEGYHLSFEGEHLAQRVAQRRILSLFALVVLVLVVLLHNYFRSLMLALQVLLNLPLALMGGLALSSWMVGNLSIATLVGFIAVGGVAARNGIMMISHYLHLMRCEGEVFGPALIRRGTLERLVPVLMTALSAGLALVPLVRAAHEPGTEILHPVAVVIVGGLVSSTLLDLVVTPAVFWAFGRRAAERAVAGHAPAAH